MAFARGRYAKAISDRSGLEFPYSEMVREWNGMFVHISEYEPKQPQLEPKPHGGDPQALQNVRTDRDENDTPRLLPHDPFTTYASGSGIINVYSPDHGLTNGTTYRFRGASSTTGTYNDPASFDGISGSNIASSSGYAITTGKYVSGSRDTDKTDNWFYFTVNTNTATAGDVKGGGFPVSIGPVTISA
jgi:hypothetical protein|tara:strand:- start:522 stop:1085 length:564 start_codon:yes stop_codon:yes gene_type:complete